MINWQLVFLLPVAAIMPAALVHATAYFHGAERPLLRPFVTAMSVTAVSMVAVVMANTPLRFLLMWEAMGLSSSWLVAMHSQSRSARRATWIYLLACHAGAALLMIAGMLQMRDGCLFAAFAAATAGFGLKIGLPPFHVWLPEAHPAAPAPASALMSGAMIPLGIYALLLFGSSFQHLFDAHSLAAAGGLLAALGALGAVGGALFAVPQNNLKKLLAFSSVENMGLVTLSVGLAMIAAGGGGGESAFRAISLAGTAVAWHVLLHALHKAGLFLAAGSIQRQTGTLELDRMGGLLRRMPMTGKLFIWHAAGLSGLPFGGALVTEMLLAAAAFELIRIGGAVNLAAGFLALSAMAFAGGLAVAVYVKCIGAALLGEPRSPEAAQAAETPRRMYLSIAALALMSLALPVAFPFALMRAPGCEPALRVYLTAVAVIALFWSLMALLALVRRRLLPRGGSHPAVPTWDCGYFAPTARMEYTGTALVQPLAEQFAGVLAPRTHVIPFRGHPSRPTDAAYATETDDRLLGWWRRIFRRTARIFQVAHLLQNGSLHFYILIIILAVALMSLAAAVL